MLSGVRWYCTSTNSYVSEMQASRRPWHVSPAGSLPRGRIPGGKKLQVPQSRLSLHASLSCSTELLPSTSFNRCSIFKPEYMRANKPKGFVVFSSEKSPEGCLKDPMPSQSSQSESSSEVINEEEGSTGALDGIEFPSLAAKSARYKNRLLNFVRIGSLVNNAAESFFKSEIRRRLFVTAVLIVASRIGYFIPLPGFDRRLIPKDYLSFVSNSVEELGDFTGELKLSLFQLGISPHIAASILMQVLCHLVPSLVKLRKEGLDGHEKIKSYIWWIALGFAILEGVVVACSSLQYSIYAATSRISHVAVTTCLLVFGAMITTWICDKISEAGFGQGSSLLICIGILTGYTETLYKMVTQVLGSSMNWWPYMFAVVVLFTIVTMWAVLVTEGCRKIKLQYYAFKLAPSSRDDSSIAEVEPYIPLNINPAGMQPVLTTSYLLAVPSILAAVLGSSFWEKVKEILSPGAPGAKPWIFYTVYAFLVFVFNIFDIANMPKEISDYMTKMGARIQNVKPGKASVEYLTKIQASTRFWGGLLLSILATSSTMLDHYLRRINEGFAIGFTSVLIIVGFILICKSIITVVPSFLIGDMMFGMDVVRELPVTFQSVGSIIELRRSYQAYNVMPLLNEVLRRYGV